MSNIENIVKNQREYFNKKKTFDVNTRIVYLKKLKSAILNHEDEIYKALKNDLGKSASESYMC